MGADGKIALEVINDSANHFPIRFERPGRVEVTVVNGEVVAHVYDGADINQEQEPLGTYMGSDHNAGWEA